MKCQVTRKDNGLDLFNDFRREFDGFFGHLVSDDASGGTGFAPILNLSESDAAFEVRLDLPGVDPDHVDLELKDGVLSISGERKSFSESGDDAGQKWHRVETRFGKFRRVVKLGRELDAEGVTADYKDGVLHVVIPKRESALPRKIEIKR